LRIFEALKNRNVLFGLAVLVGLIVGPGMAKLGWINIPVLVAVMTVAALEVRLGHFRGARAWARAAFAGVLLNLVATGLLVLAAGYLLFPAGDVRDGVVLAALSPPGLGIVPFTVVMGGNVAYSTSAFVAGYVSAVFLAPLLAGLLIGEGTVTASDFFGVLWKLVAIPLALGFLIRAFGLRDRVKPFYGTVVNWGFALMFAVLFGVNRGIFLHDPGKIAKLFLTFGLSVFLPALLIRHFLRRGTVPREDGISILLTGTVKNSLFAAALGLSLIGPAAALPGTILTFVILAYLLVVERLT